MRETLSYKIVPKATSVVNLYTATLGNEILMQVPKLNNA